MRSRFAVVCGLLAAAAVIVLSIPAAVAVAHGEREGQFVELQQEAADAAATSSPEHLVVVDDVRDDDPRAAAKRRGEREHRYGLYGGDGGRTAGDGPASLEPELAAALDGHTRTARVGDVIAVAFPLDEQGAALRASEPAAEVDSQVREAVGRLMAAAALLVLVAPLVAWLVAGRLVRPLEDVAAAAARIGDGDFGTVAPIPGVKEIDQVAVALNTSADRISTLIRRERQLTADASHQLRTPLAGLRLTLEGEHASPGGDPANIIREALGAVHRLEQTVEDLTTLARGETPPTRVDLRAVADEAAVRWSRQYHRAGRPLTVTGTTTWAPRVRPAALETIVDVLLENALRHGDGRVRVHVEAADDAVTLAVSDEGRCARPDRDLFTRSVSGAGGTGIGLDLARSTAAGERGDLQLTDADPTTFTLRLPDGTTAGPAFTNL